MILLVNKSFGVFIQQKTINNRTWNQIVLFQIMIKLRL